MSTGQDATEYVYLIGNGDSPVVKIGRSIDVPGRLAAIQYMSPLRLTVLWQTKGGAELETALHRHFKALRSHGEWFEFPNGDAPGQVMQAMVEIAAEERRQRVERRRLRKGRKARRVYRSHTGRRQPKRKPRRAPKSLNGFLVGDVVRITRDSWTGCPTGIIRSIWDDSEHPFIVMENDGRGHWWLPQFKTGEIARQSEVRELPSNGMCDRTGCFCEGAYASLTPEERQYYHGAEKKPEEIADLYTRAKVIIERQERDPARTDELAIELRKTVQHIVRSGLTYAETAERLGVTLDRLRQLSPLLFRTAKTGAGRAERHEIS